MITYQFSPPTPATKVTGTFTQAILLKDGDSILGRAMWTTTDPTQGVIQLLELWIDPALRRTGNGRRLFRELLQQARLFHKPLDQPVRRVWIAIGHKSRVVGRSFLTSEGFHHISTTGGVLQDEDQLIYVKSLD